MLVRKVLKERKLTKRWLAEQVGCHPATITKLLRVEPKKREPMAWSNLVLPISQALDIPAPVVTYSADQAEWNKFYEHLTPEERRALMTVARSMVKPG